MKKKKIIIIFAIILIIALFGGLGTWWFIQSQKDKKTPVGEEKTENKIVVKENVDVEIMSELLSPEYFFEEIDKDQDLEISYYKDDNTYEFPDKYNELGIYNVVIIYKDQKYKTILNVIDTIIPTLELQEVTIKESDPYDIKDFVKACSDNSEKECILEYSESKTYDKEGSYDITIIAKDESGNSTNGITKLNIEKKENTNNNNSTNKNNNTSSNQSNSSNKNNNKNNNSNNSSNKNNSDNNTNNSANNKPLENGATFVETKKEVNTTTEDFKYGVKIKKTTTTTYDLYSDGTKKNLKTFSNNSYDHNGFNATTNDLLAEATTNRQTYANFVNQILNKTNEYRAEVGAAPLTLDENLTKAAMVRAAEMGYAKTFSHTRPNDTSCFTVFKDLGINYSLAGENIASGQLNGNSAANSWRHSPGHYGNMINTGFKKIGIGVMKFNGIPYYVQLFTN